MVSPNEARGWSDRLETTSAVDWGGDSAFAGLVNSSLEGTGGGVMAAYVPHMLQASEPINSSGEAEDAQIGAFI